MEIFSKEQSNIFEKIWVLKNKDGQYGITHNLDDDEYINYKIWEDIHTLEMFKKHLPDTSVFRGSNPNIIFHAGCLGCLSQRLHGIDRCKGCTYFKFTNKTNFFIEGEDAATMSADDLKDFLK